MIIREKPPPTANRHASRMKPSAARLLARVGLAKPEQALSAEHREELAASGIDPATAVRGGVYTEDDPAEAQRRLNWRFPAALSGPWMVFRYFDRHGRDTGYARLKPRRPRTEPRKDGTTRPIKYEAPIGSSPRLYIPPDSRATVNDPAADLIITEGEKKALSADSAGFACVGVSGVDAWRAKGGGLIPDLDELNWDGRRVFIAFDSDVTSNPNVQRAERDLAEALTRRGADVRLVRLEGGAE
jgi:hypothetical protein